MIQDDRKAYSKEKHNLAIADLFLTPLILAVFILLGILLYLRDISSMVFSNSYLSLLFFSAFVALVYYLATLPLAIYSGFLLEHKYKLSNQTFGDWVKREVKKITISFIVSIPLIFCVYTFIRYWPLYWWFLTALVWFFMSIVLAKFAPILIVPLFYKFSPINDIKLKDRLTRLASIAGFKTQGVYEINLSKDTKKANAALMGLGNQKRIVLTDTLLGNFNTDEIESVMGHELGHHKKRHVLKLVVFGGGLGILVFYVTDIIFLKLHGLVGYALLYDFESLVLIYAIITALNILVLPIHNAFSRKLEREADMFAFEITDNKGAFISAMEKLSFQNLADTSPGKFYEIMLYDHPPIARRISFAKSFKK